jgi:DNA-binding PadR family transcriptional regulator
MIKSFILFFLQAKPTHGYEIQRFIKMNQMDSWTKIQSGSIYYALSKLEKEHFIELDRKEPSLGKVRKIYRITESGRRELIESLKEELDHPLQEIGSDKFILYPLLGMLNREEAEEEIKSHINGLEEKLWQMKKWQRKKVGEKTAKIEKLSFEIIITSIEMHIAWHKALLEDLDVYRGMSEQLISFISKVDFSAMGETPSSYDRTNSGGEEVEELKQKILEHPEAAEENLNRLISILKEE